jgi:uncharacterized membrane protein YkvA (DUF1232 family)
VKRTAERLKAWAQRLGRDVLALWLAARDDRVPPRAKIVAALVAAYALSPIDLIPDFVPVLGYLDDLLIVPVGVWFALKLIPRAVMDDLRAQTAARSRPVSWSGLAMVMTVWLAAAALTAWLLWPDAGGANLP